MKLITLSFNIVYNIKCRKPMKFTHVHYVFRLLIRFKLFSSEYHYTDQRFLVFSDSRISKAAVSFPGLIPCVSHCTLEATMRRSAPSRSEYVYLQHINNRLSCNGDFGLIKEHMTLSLHSLAIFCRITYPENFKLKFEAILRIVVLKRTLLVYIVT
jgi:hypothetical protein